MKTDKIKTNYYYKKRPLEDLSFKGLSLYKAEEILSLSEKHLGKTARDLFEKVKHSKRITIMDDKISIHKKTIPQLIWDGLLLRNKKIDSDINNLHGLFELADSVKGKNEKEISDVFFHRGSKMFDKTKGNYDTKHERALNRLVSGLPPAIFLANDAYNLSRGIDDDPKAAKKEKRDRFKQEVSRIFFSGYLTLITLGALQKYINNSKIGIMLMTGTTVLATEMFSRLSNKKPITRLKPEQAQEINAKNGVTEFKTEPHDKAQKPLLTIKTLMKASAAIIATGFAIKGARKIKLVNKPLEFVEKNYSKLYKGLTEIPEYKMPVEKFNQITDVLKQNGFKEIADKYTSIAANSTKDGVINFGKKEKPYKSLVDFALAPFKFIARTIKLPYNLAQKAVQMFSKTPEKPAPTDISILAQNIDRISKKALKKNFKPKEFQEYMNDRIMKSFNTDNVSNIANSDLSNLAKTSATAATIWFLMTDNYNMVMLKSNGKDKEGAELKFKERFVQEGSRLFYQTLLIDLFNNTFRHTYNNSLAGMSLLTVTNTTLGEMLTRKSVGMPLKPHTKEELIKIEQKKASAKGFLKSYYTFMSKLTGKRPVSIKSEKTPRSTIPAVFKGVSQY